MNQMTCRTARICCYSVNIYMQVSWKKNYWCAKF